MEASKELVDETYNVLQSVKQSGKVKKGINEATKSIERGTAIFVAYASDVQPPEIVAHLPKLCEDKKVPLIEVPSKLDLGKSINLNVPCAAIAVESAGSAEASLKSVISKLTGKSAEKPKAEPKEKKEEAKESKPAEHKEAEEAKKEDKKEEKEGE